MTVYINGTTGYSGPVGTIGDLTTTGNTTLGDASGDTLTINGSTTTLTQGTANGVAYLNASKVLTTGSALVFDGTTLKNAQSSSGATPSSNGNGLVLDSSGNGGLTIATGASSLGNIFFADSGDSADGFVQYDQSGRSMRFGTATAEKMRLDSSGNLGLGVTPSAWTAGGKTIELGAAGNIFYGATSFFGYAQNGYYNSGWKFANASSARASYYEQTGGGHAWAISTAAGTAGNAITFTQAMTLDASGNLGVGTTGQTSRISATGSSSTDFYALTLRNSSGTTGSAAVLTFEASTGTQGDAAASVAYIKGIRTGAGTTGDLAFWTTNAGTPAERARIDSSGNLTMGGGSFVGSYFTMYRSSSSNTVAATPSIVLANQNATSGTFMLGGMFGNAYRDVSSSSVVAGVWMEAQNGGAGALAKAGNVYIGAQDYGGGWNTPTARLSVLYTGTIQFNAYGSGSLSTNASGVISASDGRFKTKTRGITNALDKVLQLADAATFYRWNEGTPWHTEYEEIGWVAQDVAAIIPEASPEPEVPIETGDYGEPQVSKFKNYHDRAILAYMASAIKELKAEFDAYKLTHP